ncbi:fimbrial protein [Xenorhabdus hominickii]|uniref:Fimbrial adhesin protein n=1 Tax=Xenorhabdus hominickii TaxID=351679 RepID=A0A2G0QBA4_XENHO|nr:fimbrial protein [Xenorhabdus hominickii]AOM40612.1 hypothetical protein A9255_08430 [Xenorhabdus hominickii]PHM56439.1 fimbrial adhesin protein precursor [Xenorhabdus hominickii]
MFILHKKYRLLLAASIMLLGLFVSTYSRAGPCLFDPKFAEQKISVSAGIFLVRRELNVGEIIGSYPINTIGIKNYTCDDSEKVEWEFTGYPLIAINSEEGLHDSGISGIGIRMNTQGNETKVEFVKTKPKTGSGVITSGLITARLDGTAIYSFYLNEIHFITPSCSLKENNILVPMGKIGKTQFAGINSTAEARYFKVDLACNISAPIELVMGSIRPSNANDVLGLDQDSNSAGGVGLQVLYQDQPVIFNSPVKIGMSTDGVYSIPFKARYIQTKSRIMAGKANATATLNIIYP